jgi:hypothetical protein
MGINRVSGNPNYTNTGSSRYIPIVFSAKTLTRFYATTVLNEIANTDYVGEITAKGDTVVIRTIPDININTYVKGMNLDLQNPESPAIELTIDHANYFNFGIDDVDEKQFDVKRISEWADNAAKRLKITVETAVFADIYADAATYNKGITAGYIEQNILLGTNAAPIAITPTNVVRKITEMGQCLTEYNVPEDGRWMIVPAWFSTMLQNSELKDASLTGKPESPLLNGMIGSIGRFKIYDSNLLYKVTGDGGQKCTNILFGHKAALAFAIQLTKTETYRPERAFANAMKGLQVHGYKVVQPTALGNMVAYQG